MFASWIVPKLIIFCTHQNAACHDFGVLFSIWHVFSFWLPALSSERKGIMKFERWQFSMSNEIPPFLGQPLMQVSKLILNFMINKISWTSLIFESFKLEKSGGLLNLKLFKSIFLRLKSFSEFQKSKNLNIRKFAEE